MRLPYSMRPSARTRPGGAMMTGSARRGGLSAAGPLTGPPPPGANGGTIYPPPQSNSSDAASYTHTHGITVIRILYKRQKDNDHNEAETD